MAAEDGNHEGWVAEWKSVDRKCGGRLDPIIDRKIGLPVIISASSEGEGS